MKKLLSVFLFLSALMPLFAGLTGLYDHRQMLTMFRIADGPGSLELVTIIAVCFIPLAFLQFIAGYWTWNGHWHGIVLARWAGALILFAGITMYLVLGRADIAGADIIKGAIILLLGMLVRKHREVPHTELTPTV
jgi:hypothetical protein